MRNAEAVLNVIRERGERGLPLEDIYRQLHNRELYLRAYGHLYSNQGAMTKGTTSETVGGMSLLEPVEPVRQHDWSSCLPHRGLAATPAPFADAEGAGTLVP